MAHQANTQVVYLKDLHTQLSRDIAFLANRMSHYYNRTRVEGPTFKEGDKVYLLRKNIKTKRPSNKLDFKKLGPFKVAKRIGTLNYELDLPQGMKIHPVFHILLLEPALENARLATHVEVEIFENDY